MSTITESSNSSRRRKPWSSHKIVLLDPGFRRDDGQRGFTLIEVLVALAIIAFGMTALFTTVNQTVRTSSYLREKTLAEWIALNHITEVRLSGQPPTDENTQGKVEYAGTSWRWELKALKTPVDGILRLEARAALESDREGSWPGQATGFMSVPTASGPAAIAPPSTSSDPWVAIAPPQANP